MRPLDRAAKGMYTAQHQPRISRYKTFLQTHANHNAKFLCIAGRMGVCVNEC